MRTRLPVLAASLTAGLALAASGLTGLSGAQAATPPGLRVSGSKVVEANGTPFIARGVSHAHTWYKSQTASAIPAIKAAGANSLRVVLASGDRWEKDDTAAVTSIVNQCKTSRLICMLEVHDTTGFNEQSGAISLDRAVDYWISIKSALVGNEDFIQLNIGNEPYGNGASASNWTTDTSNAIKRLRSNGFRNQIVVDAPHWGQDWGGIMKNTASQVAAADVDGNTVFSVHMYGVYDTAAEVRDYLGAFVNAGLPIIVGEFGIDHSDGNPDEDTIMSETQRLGLGYYGWSWSGNGGGVEYLDMVTSFNPNSFTTWGNRIFSGANGIKSTSKEATWFTRGTNPTTPPVTTSRPPVEGTTPPPTTTTAPPVGNGGCSATFSVGSSWGGGFVGTVKVTAGSSAIRGWNVRLSLPSGTSIANLWNGSLSGTSVSNAGYNGSLGAGQSAEFGFQGSGSASGLSVASCTAS